MHGPLLSSKCSQRDFHLTFSWCRSRTGWGLQVVCSPSARVRSAGRATTHAEGRGQGDPRKTRSPETLPSPASGRSHPVRWDDQHPSGPRTTCGPYKHVRRGRPAPWPHVLLVEISLQYCALIEHLLSFKRSTWQWLSDNANRQPSRGQSFPGWVPIPSPRAGPTGQPGSELV